VLSAGVERLREENAVLREGNEIMRLKVHNQMLLDEICRLDHHFAHQHGQRDGHRARQQINTKEVTSWPEPLGETSQPGRDIAGEPSCRITPRRIQMLVGSCREDTAKTDRAAPEQVRQGETIQDLV